MDDTLADLLNRPLAIGARTIPGRLVLAPMTDLGHVAFRQLLAEFGGYGLLWSEMCGARRLPMENSRYSRCFRWREAERTHLVFQIVGSQGPRMADAARRIEAEGFFGVDLNFGCSVRAICKQGSGAQLLKTPERAGDIVAAVRRAVACPVLVKFRTGWQDDPAPAVAMARRFEAAGADALTFHPRVAPDRRTRPPRWAYIAAVKQAVRIPVFGNGNVFFRRRLPAHAGHHRLRRGCGGAHGRCPTLALCRVDRGLGAGCRHIPAQRPAAHRVAGCPFRAGPGLAALQTFCRLFRRQFQVWPHLAPASEHGRRPGRGGRCGN